MIVHNGLFPQFSEKRPLARAFPAPFSAGPQSGDQVQFSAQATTDLRAKPYLHPLGGVLVLPGLCEKGEDVHGVIDHLSHGGVNNNGGILNAKFMKDFPPSRIARMSNEQLRDALGLKHEGNLFAMTYTNNDNPVAQNAKELKWATEIVSRLSGDARVDLVAHSKGGLDARKYLEDPQEKVGKLITIGTPHRGSWLAVPEVWTGEWFGRLFLGKSGAGGTRDVMPEWLNDTLRRLNANTALQESRADIVSIATRGDGVVDLNSAVLNKQKSYVLYKIKHVEQLDSKAVQELVGQLLAR